MEVHQLRYFCAIVKHGTFTRAAMAEHVSQPSLSQQIIKLEDELGGKLFDRLPRTSRLTTLGQTFLPRALAVLQAIRDGKAEARQIVAPQQSLPAENSISIPPTNRTDTLSRSDNRVNAFTKSA